MIRFPLQRLLLPFCLIVFGIQPAFAFKLLPISREFAPSGKDSTQSYQIVNDKNERLAVEVSVVQRQIDLTGTESYQPAADDFLIYPSQILLEPNEIQTVRVTWLGDPTPEKELAYRLVAEQLPVDLESPQAANSNKPVGQIKLLLRYLGSLYIRPDNVQPDVVLDTIGLQAGSDGAQALTVTFNNQGTAHASLKNLKLHLTSPSQGIKVDLQPEQLPKINNAVILAGSKRQFVLPWPASLPVGPVTATFEFDPPR